MRKLVIFVTAKKTPMYPQEIVQPMRDELTAVGFKQINDVEQVEAEINASGTTLVVVNSICGCAAANARRAYVFHSITIRFPSNLVTVLQELTVKQPMLRALWCLSLPLPLPWLCLRMENWCIC